MKPTIKAEFRKLLSVRSTYLITGFSIIFLIFIAFYVIGWRMKPADLHQTNQLASDVYGGLTLSLLGAVVAILSMTHEYRYNTIMYSLTASNSRTKVLLSKVIAISVYALFLTVVLGVLSPIATYLGVHAHGHALVPQVLHYKDLIWRSLFYGWAYGMLGLVLASLIRIQVGAIVALFAIPAFVEPLLSQLLNKNAVYLPYSALAQIVGDSAPGGGTLAPGRAALVFMGYLVVAWVIAWYLFLRRDAN